MDIFRQLLKISTIASLIFLAVISIISAFFGAERAQCFFNSIAMCIFWVFLMLLLLAVLIVFKPARRTTLLAVNLGVIFVLLGGMIGSARGHKIAAQLFDIDKIPSGFMIIHQGQTENTVVSADFETVTGRLDFEVTAGEIWIEQYDNGQIKDFKSTLAITHQGRPILKKTIEVNQPLHYGGYHFYQSGFDTDNQQFTILYLVSDSGLGIVYCGYWLIIAGVFGRCWIEPIINYLKQRNRDGN